MNDVGDTVRLADFSFIRKLVVAPSTVLPESIDVPAPWCLVNLSSGRLVSLLHSLSRSGSPRPPEAQPGPHPKLALLKHLPEALRKRQRIPRTMFDDVFERLAIPSPAILGMRNENGKVFEETFREQSDMVRRQNMRHLRRRPSTHNS